MQHSLLHVPFHASIYRQLTERGPPTNRSGTSRSRTVTVGDLCKGALLTNARACHFGECKNFSPAVNHVCDSGFGPMQAYEELVSSCAAR
jgi:hypothetical protein